MRLGAFIPIKAQSRRVPGKNLREVGGKPLYRWIIDAAMQSQAFDAVFVDTDSDEIAKAAEMMGVMVIGRDPSLARDDANGNDLLCHHAERFPDFDVYCQLFATAPFLRAGTIARAIDDLLASPRNDSVLTAVEAPGWHWFNAQPINFRPGILPRSQDAPKLIRETTGLYAIRREPLLRYRCRVGATPLFVMVNPIEAVDIDDESDLARAQEIAAKL